MASEDAGVDVDILDMEFNSYLKISRELMKKMRLADDRRVCEKYIRSCLSMKNSDQLQVKHHRNRFFRYLLKTMDRTVKSQAKVYVNLSEGASMENGQDTEQWSADRKSYVAARIIPGFGTLVYMACTDDPELGWEKNGFANFVDLSDVPYIPGKKNAVPAAGDKENQREAQAAGILDPDNSI